MALEFQPDTLIINETEITGHVYDERGDVAFYDTERTLLGPVTLLTDISNMSLFHIGDEVLHTHNNGVELDPHLLYFVANIPKRRMAGGIVEETDHVGILLSENRPA